jgi:predicted transcriptional regulator
MTALTVRLADEKYQRLKALAQARGTSVNRLVDEMATMMLAEFDAETRFAVRAQRGKGREEEGLALLEKVATSGARNTDSAVASANPDAPPRSV